MITRTPSNWIERTLATARQALFRSRPYDLSLNGGDAAPQRTPPDLWAGTETARAGQPDAFHWLGRGAGTSAEEARARLAAWLDAHGTWSAAAWRLDVLGDRLVNWLVHFEALAADADAGFRHRLAAALHRQARHLDRWALRPEPDADPIAVIRAAVITRLALAGDRAGVAPLLSALENRIQTQINPDGGHWERNPARHARTLANLLDIRAALAAQHREVPTVLQGAVDRMAPVLRMLRHGDGGLALFNGAGEGIGAEIERILEASESRGRPAASAPHTGFHRLNAGRTMVLMDTGAPVDAFPFSAGHAGTLAFEMSVGRQRVIVNCGGAGGGLGEALRATAAHSTLTLDDTHSADLADGAGFGALRPVNVQARRREAERNVLVEASHDGYAGPHGVVHHRSLFLARDGLDLRGEDVLEAPARTGRPFAIRFHLHPDIRASVAEGGRTALLQLPTGRGWKLAISDGGLELEDSIYTGHGEVRRSQQIVVSGRHARRRTVAKWRLAREG